MHNVFIDKIIAWFIKLAVWLKEPSNIISISAAFISAATFYYIYWDKGELTVIIPERVGVTLTDGDLSLLVPITLTNDGSPRQMRHITNMTLKLTKIEPIDIDPQSISARWRTEFTYIGPHEYYTKYFQILTHFDKLPSAEENEKERLLWFLHDKVDFKSRAAPFALFGGDTEQKLFEFVQFGRGFEKAHLKSFRMQATIETERKKYLSEPVAYSCSNTTLAVNNYKYCTSED